MDDLATIIVALLPFLVVSLILVFITYRLSIRKGRNPLLAWLGVVPGVQVIVIIWLASLTDKSVLEKITKLEADKH